MNAATPPKPAPAIATVGLPGFTVGQGVTVKQTGKGAYFAGALAEDPSQVLVRDDESGEWVTLPVDKIEHA